MEPTAREDAIRQKLCEFVRTSPRNALKAFPGIRIYDEPLVGIAAADDPWFEAFLDPAVVGPAFIKPRQWLPGAKSVVSYYLPFTKQVYETNRRPGLPSEEWVAAKAEGEAFDNIAIGPFVVDLLEGFGAGALIPARDGRFRIADRVSNWSERHVAFAAGLGTFGLHAALITKKGCTGRMGSVVTTLELSPTRRDYTTYYAYCLYLTRGECGACIGRCPAGALSGSGKDHGVCDEYIIRDVRPKFHLRYGCGKCNAAVPCESGIPKALRPGGPA